MRKRLRHALRIFQMTDEQEIVHASQEVHDQSTNVHPQSAVPRVTDERTPLQGCPSIRLPQAIGRPRKPRRSLFSFHMYPLRGFASTGGVTSTSSSSSQWRLHTLPQPLSSSLKQPKPARLSPIDSSVWARSRPHKCVPAPSLEQ